MIELTEELVYEAMRLERETKIKLLKKQRR